MLLFGQRKKGKKTAYAKMLSFNLVGLTWIEFFFIFKKKFCCWGGHLSYYFFLNSFHLCTVHTVQGENAFKFISLWGISEKRLKLQDAIDTGKIKNVNKQEQEKYVLCKPWWEICLFNIIFRLCKDKNVVESHLQMKEILFVTMMFVFWSHVMCVYN